MDVLCFALAEARGAEAVDARLRDDFGGGPDVGAFGVVGVEEGDEFVLDAFGGGAGDLLAADAGGEAAEGVDCLGEAGGAEDVAGVGGDEGREAGFDGYEVLDCVVEESAGCAGWGWEAGFGW